jgi:hypothetical protein
VHFELPGVSDDIATAVASMRSGPFAAKEEENLFEVLEYYSWICGLIYTAGIFEFAPAALTRLAFRGPSRRVLHSDRTIFVIIPGEVDEVARQRMLRPRGAR